MAPIPPQHIQAVRPVRPSALIRSNHVRQAPLVGAQQGEAQRAGNVGYWCPREVGGVTKDIGRRAGRSCGYFTNHGDVDAVGEILQPIADRKLDRTVDIVQILVGIILGCQGLV